MTAVNKAFVFQEAIWHHAFAIFDFFSSSLFLDDGHFHFKRFFLGFNASR